MSNITFEVSTVPVRKTYGAQSSTGMFAYKSGTSHIGRDVLKDPYFDKILEGGFTTLTHGNGGISNEYGVVSDPLYFGGTGNGYNPMRKPLDCVRYHGDLCTVFTLNDKNLDFFWSHNELRKRGEMSSYIIANMFSAPIEQTYLQIEACQPQRLINIQLGEEGLQDQWGTGVVYATKAYEWMDLIQARYEGQKFRFFFDIPILFHQLKRTTEWCEQIASVRPIDPEIIGIRQYCHLFELVGLNGDTDHDVAECDKAMTIVMAEYKAAIEASVFRGCRVYISQVSAHEYEVAKSQFYLVSNYLRMADNFIKWLVEDVTRVIGQCVIGTNSFIGKDLKPILDWKWLTVINKMWNNGNKVIVNIQHEMGDKVDILGVRDNEGNYRMIFQNRSALGVSLPNTYNGKPISFIQKIGEKCQAQDATDSVPYAGEGGMLAPYSILFTKFPEILS